MATQHEITTPAPLLTPAGRLTEAGWARQPLLDCNLGAVRFYRRDGETLVLEGEGESDLLILRAAN